jgi:hypothetical protein
MLSRLTVGRVALAWFAFLWIAALILPSLGSHAQAHPAAKAFVAAGYVTLLVSTPIALIDYFNRAWRRVGAVADTTAYVIWLSLESIAGAGVLRLLLYSATMFVATRLR